ncbi:52 kDa repressor of the inhibitor of the protein kinase-like isoform X1 [Monomorium pharaonis]|uniref:52 kDa repressor of the inhibitor of the protein kinase-like isoform X1 n=1 Tax=Monomorium pharaonis TaxID=307658 RepID=UPI001746B0D7|nr:52 kDa repressor of the inhibitor of the protein kinase-like isoform X1 [Monomorium pharaonis]
MGPHPKSMVFTSLKGTKGISFFRFPKDIVRAELWLKFCKRQINIPLEKLCNNYRICSEHFTDVMFLNNLRNRLQPHAIPTINVLDNSEPLSEALHDKYIETEENVNGISTCGISETHIENEMINIDNECIFVKNKTQDIKRRHIEIVNKVMEDKLTQTELKLSYCSPRKKN